MTAPKVTFNFQNYKGVLPYASELFGVYQPLLGWKSKRIKRRFERGYAFDQLALIEQLASAFKPNLMVSEGRTAIELKDFDPGRPYSNVAYSRSLLVNAMRDALQEKYQEKAEYISDEELDFLLELPTLTSFLRNEVVSKLNTSMAGPLAQARAAGTGAATQAPSLSMAQAKTALEYEARLATALLELKDNRQYEAVRKLLFPTDWRQTHAGVARAANSKSMLDLLVPQDSDPLAELDPNFDLDRVAMSPIGVVHLFRQYFFELDSFLGSPIGHVWLSPGTTLELIEINTRKVVVEKTFEESIESTKKSEVDSTNQDEMADAVKQDNQQDIKFGASVTATYAGVTASSNFDMHNTQKQAREATHKHMRQQSTKLATEIKSNYKTTFKTTTETSNSTSKRYLIQNPSSQLQNYELRRKMRQVAIQVQDVGTYLCWQTFADRPGDTLELPSLVHVAQPADLISIPLPQLEPAQDAKTIPFPIDFAYENTSTSEGHEMDVTFYEGSDKESGTDNNDRIVWRRDYHLDLPALGYTLDHESLQIASLHTDVCVAQIFPLFKSPGVLEERKVRVELPQVNFADQPAVKLLITATWNPPSAAVDPAEMEKKIAEIDSANARAIEEAYNKAVSERITLASKIKTRPAEELREEERITVYRKLIQDMLLPAGYGTKEKKPSPAFNDTPATRHVLSELINSIFDVDKMLYFVAPEYWKPRKARAVQAFGGKPADYVGPVSVANQVSWESMDGAAREHYFITEDSSPAKLGSSLGWTMQLDGDNLRNAFLNAPWVKAVMPIRPGKEKAAINWLKHVEGFEGIGPKDIYAGDGTDADGNPMKGKLLVDVIDYLADTVARKHELEFATKAYDLTDPKLPHDPDSTVTATPVDRVWEHGFNPLVGGFQARPTASADPDQEFFETFDQWVEILPTDQVVPVVVEYDPRTGRLKDPAA